MLRHVNLQRVISSGLKYVGTNKELLLIRFLLIFGFHYEQYDKNCRQT